MTRINCVPVWELSNKHLVAEYHELPRVYNLAIASYERGEKLDDHGDRYVLSKGHVRFFYSRLGYINKRYDQLVIEMLARGYKPSWAAGNGLQLDEDWMRDWSPSPEDLDLNRRRLAERGGRPYPQG